MPPANALSLLLQITRWIVLQKARRPPSKAKYILRSIENKYREGKMKSTLERELKVREIVEREALEVSHAA